MSKFIILKENSTQEVAEWMELWHQWPGREIFAHPNYVRLFCRECDTAICALFKQKHGCVLFPLILRPLESEPWAADLSDLYDLSGPYGYGGPYYWGKVDPNIFWQQFDSWATEKGIVSLFTRLSLFPDQYIHFPETKEVAQNVVRTLDVAPDKMWMRYEHKVRKNVKRARALDIEILRDEKGDRLDDFLYVYYSTMDRRNAHKSYRFPRSFFSSLIEHLSPHFTFFFALREGRVISSELVLLSDRNIYSFLGGTISNSYPMRPNDVIKHQIIQWGYELGKDAFVLGGGYEGNDGIYRFKRSFAPDGIRPFCVGRRFWDEKLYLSIVDKRRNYEHQLRQDWTPSKDFFPAYRAS